MKVRNKRKYLWFVKIQTDLLFDEEVSAEAKVLYGSFYRYSSDRREQYPWTIVANQKIASQLGIKREKVEKLVRELKKAEWITILITGVIRIIVLFPDKEFEIVESKKREIEQKAKNLLAQFMSYPSYDADVDKMGNLE